MNDLVNGLFEGFGALVIWLNFRQLLRDKVVLGVRWEVTAFFTLWGVWNLYYYPSLGQWLSFAGGLVLVAGNAAWLCLAVYYLRVRPWLDFITHWSK